MKFNLQKVVNPPGFSLLSIIIFSAFFLFALNSCKRELTTESKPDDQKLQVSGQNLLQDSKNYFSSLANEEKILLSQPTKKIPKNSLLRKNARIAKISNLINWEGSKLVDYNGLNFLLVPFNETIKPFRNKDFEFCRNLIFFNDSIGTLKMNIVEVLSEKGTSLGDSLGELCKTSFLNNYFKQANSFGSIDAHVIFYTDRYKEQTVFEFTKGQWSLSRERFSFRSDMEIY